MSKSALKLEHLSKSELIDEIRRLRGEPIPAFKQRYGVVKVKRKPKREPEIVAGMDIRKDDLLVVDEANQTAYVHPTVQVVPNKIRIHGYAVQSFKKGQTVKMHHWFDYEPRGLQHVAPPKGEQSA